jgi:hypothetical protein
MYTQPAAMAAVDAAPAQRLDELVIRGCAKFHHAHDIQSSQAETLREPDRCVKRVARPRVDRVSAGRDREVQHERWDRV